jgi:hypothetical protein
MEYSRKQLENAYLQLKKDKIKRSSEVKILEEVFKQFQVALAQSRLIQNN